MNIQEIRELAKIMQETGLTSVHLTEGALDIQMERGGAVVSAVSPVPMPVEAAVLPQPIPAPAVQQPVEEAPAASSIDFNHITEVKSPMVGVFYAAPSPDAQPYVQVGSKVKKGETLCVIEAMKVMNEVTAEADGEVVDICVKDGDLVEYGCCLMKIY